MKPFWLHFFCSIKKVESIYYCWGKKMFEQFLPSRICGALNKLNKKGLQEVRIRVKQPVIVRFGRNFYLGEDGITDQKEFALVCSYDEMQEIIYKACECSIYAYNNELKELFITLKDGQRIGVCGETVFEDGKIKTIKNFSSINIRLLHQVPNCSLNALPFLCDENGIFNTLIVAPPGAGKTTFLRDLCYQFSNKHIVDNLLLIDERGEIAQKIDDETIFNVGENTDVLSYSTKEFGIMNGIRVFTPNVVLMDELANSQDVMAIDYAIGSGVKIVATAHAQNLVELFKKPHFKSLLEQKVFERFVVLSCRDGAGTIEGVFNNKQANLLQRTLR